METQQYTEKHKHCKTQIHLTDSIQPKIDRNTMLERRVKGGGRKRKL